MRLLPLIRAGLAALMVALVAVPLACQEQGGGNRRHQRPARTHEDSVRWAAKHGVQLKDSAAQTPTDSTAGTTDSTPSGGDGEDEGPDEAPGGKGAYPLPTSLHKSSASSRPNEPSGYQPFAEYAGDWLPNRPALVPEPDYSTGSWFREKPQAHRVRIIEDPTAPISPPLVLATIFPKGFPSGNGPVSMGGWDEHGREPAGQKRAVYVSIWLKINGNDFEQSPAGTKLGFFGVGRDPSKAGNELVLVLEPVGGGGPSAAHAFRLKFHQQGHLGDVDYKPNRQAGAMFTAGQWHQFELVMVLNDLGNKNGRLRWWLDGKELMSYDNVTYITRGNTNGFHGWKWNPTWNGVNYHRTRGDQILIDHVYMSGLPLR